MRETKRDGESMPKGIRYEHWRNLTNQNEFTIKHNA